MINFAGDTRYGEGVVATHDRSTLEAVPVSKLVDVHRVADYDVIGIDEGQFFPDLVECVHEWCEQGKVRQDECMARRRWHSAALVWLDVSYPASQTVLVAALDGDFLRRPFGRVLELVPLAEHVSKLTAVCTVCYGSASFTKRTVAAMEVQLVGGAESYQPVCRKCFVDAPGPAAVAHTPLKVAPAVSVAGLGFAPAGGSPGSSQFSFAAPGVMSDV